jgi:hypothetical protein
MRANIPTVRLTLLEDYLRLDPHMILVKNIGVVVKILQQDVSKREEWIIRVLNKGVTVSRLAERILGPQGRIMRI